MARPGPLREPGSVTRAPSSTPEPPPARRQRVVVVDDSDGFRSLLQWFLCSLPEIEIVAEARNGIDAIAEVERTKPDLVLMDVCMPTLDGLQATRRLRKVGESVRIVLLTAHGDTIPLWLAEEVGADDVLDKSNLAEQLREAVMTPRRPSPRRGAAR